MAGTLASIVGGALVGLAYYVAIICCVQQVQVTQAPHQYIVIVVGAAAGMLGSMVDSVLGAWLQYSGEEKQIVTVRFRV